MQANCSYIGRAAINSTYTDRLESRKDGNRHGRRALAFPVKYTANGSLCAVHHPRFPPAIPNAHDASSLSQKNHGLEVLHVSGLNFACQLSFNAGGFKSLDSQASTCFSLGSFKSWLRHPCFGAYRKPSRKPLRRHLVVVLGLTLHVNRGSLARATGPFSFHGSFCLVKVNGRKPSPRGQGWHNQFLDPLYETPYKFNSIFLSRYSNVNETFFLSAFLRRHSTP